MEFSVAGGQGLCDRVSRIRERIEAAAKRSGRDPSDVSLMAVTKTRGARIVRQAIGAGLSLFGENYIQEADEKIRELRDGSPNIRWHFIGHLQKNKVKRAVELFDCIETIDSIKLAETLDRRARDAGRRMPILCQVNLAGERQKAGISPEGLKKLIEKVMDLSGLRLDGLMILPPYSPDPEKTREWFSALRRLRDNLESELCLDGRLKELSMGMSHDYEVAVEEGATIVRVGTALFGPRDIK